MSSEVRQQTSSGKLAEAQACVQRGMQLRQHVAALRKSSDVAGGGGSKSMLKGKSPGPGAPAKTGCPGRDAVDASPAARFALNKKEVNQKSSEIFVTAEFPVTIPSYFLRHTIP